MKKLLLLRHATHVLHPAPAAAQNPRFYGRTDMGLADAGRLQAAACVPILRQYLPERCFCSPLRRCLETIRPMAAMAAMAVEVHPDLMEVDFGRWEGLTFDEIQHADPDTVRRWADYDPDFAFPGGERLADFSARMRRLAAFFTGCPETTVLAVTHAGVIRALVCHFLGLDPRQYILFSVDFCSLTTLDIFGDKGVLTGLNIPCPLERG